MESSFFGGVQSLPVRVRHDRRAVGLVQVRDLTTLHQPKELDLQGEWERQFQEDRSLLSMARGVEAVRSRVGRPVEGCTEKCLRPRQRPCPALTP